MHVEAARALIADHLAVGLETVRDDAHFAEDLGADSLDLIELAMRFEEAFDIHIPDDETASCETVGDALALLRGKVVASKAA
jgi:acyl carrier protein